MISAILKSWIDSVSIFLPHNFKKFVYQTMETFAASMRPFWTYIGWLVALEIMLLLLAVYSKNTVQERGIDPQSGFAFPYSLFAVSSVTFFVICFYIVNFYLFVAVRQTKQEKNGRYFLSYAWHLVTYYFVERLFVGLTQAVSTLTPYVSSYIGKDLTKYSSMSIHIFVKAIFFFFTFFLLENKKLGGEIIQKAFYDAFKFTVKNLPICILYPLLLMFSAETLLRYSDSYALIIIFVLGETLVLQLVVSSAAVFYKQFSRQ
ncbi:hypothetical protein HYX58_00870 [Candidatus Dependentiae bacterium]|nr:hypothetical protein [Candidatus Dependentiae bacterium]